MPAPLLLLPESHPLNVPLLLPPESHPLLVNVPVPLLLPAAAHLGM